LIEENNIERQTRLKVENQRADLYRDLDDLNSKLEEAGNVFSAQVETIKRRDAEVAQLKRDFVEAHMQHENNARQIKQKNQVLVAELAEQIDQLQKNKHKLVKIFYIFMKLINLSFEYNLVDWKEKNKIINQKLTSTEIELNKLVKEKYN
jgi:hypothetical protein